MPPASPQTNEQWVKDRLCECYDAMRRLQSAKKESTSAFDTRLRKLKAFAEVLFVKRADSAQLEMFEIKEIFPDELADLLEFPTRGL